MNRKALAALLLLLTGVVSCAVTSPDIPVTPELTHFGPYRPDMSLKQAFESLPPAGGERTGLALIPENLEAWVARWRMLAEARQSIDISYFIVREDVFGAALFGHLMKKAKEGVRIRILFDAQGTVMSFASPRGNDWLDTLANTPHVQIKLFRPVKNRYLTALASANPVAAVASEHDKILVCDGAHGMIGGRNISAEYFAHPADMPSAFEDLDVILKGRSVAAGLTAAFETQYESDWAHAIEHEQIDFSNHEEELTLAYQAMDAWLKGRTLDTNVANRIKSLRLSWVDDLAKLRRSRGTWSRAPTMVATAETRLLDSHARLSPGADIISQGLLRLLQSTRERVFIQSPYLVLSEEAVKVLEAAGRRGVEIVIYTNSPVSSDNAMSQAFFQEQWPELLARVPGLRLFVTGGRRTLHSKLMTFDNQTALVGTYNLDPVSMGINSEIMAAVWSRDFALLTTERPRKHLARGAPSVYEYKIKRDRDGGAVRDENGRPIVTFGPGNHAPPEQWRAIQAYWKILRVAEKLPGFSPLF